jgi:hypothetical protein
VQLYLADRGLPVGRLAHHLETAERLDQRAQATAHNGMIVDQNDGDRPVREVRHGPMMMSAPLPSPGKLSRVCREISRLLRERVPIRGDRSEPDAHRTGAEEEAPQPIRELS